MAVQSLPTTIVSQIVRDAVISEYAQLQGVDPAEVEAGFDGGVEFDSLIGVELAIGLEDALGVSIPDEDLVIPEAYESLHSFAAAIQACVDRSHSTSTGGNA